MAERIGVTRRALLSTAAAAVSRHGAEPDYDSLLRPLAERGEFMGTVLVSLGDRITFRKAYGFQARKPLPSSPSETILRFRDRPLEFPPGKAGRYSNSGYVLLAYVVERVSGNSFTDFLGRNILDPLGLDDTGVDTHRAVLSQRARGYTRFREGLGNAD